MGWRLGNCRQNVHIAWQKTASETDEHNGEQQCDFHSKYPLRRLQQLSFLGLSTIKKHLIVNFVIIND